MENKEIVLKVLSLLPKAKEILDCRDITSEEKETREGFSLVF